MAAFTRVRMAAETSMEYAHSKLWGRSSNRSEDLAHAAHIVLEKSNYPKLHVTAKSSGPLVAQLNFQIAYHIAEKDHRKWLDELRDDQGAYGVDNILQKKIGNCQEHAILVADYVKRNYSGISVYFIGIKSPCNHAFIILGAPTNLPVGNDAFTLTFPNAPSALGVGSWVVDAWWHDYYPVQGTEWNQKLAPTLRETRTDKTVLLPASIVCDVVLMS